MGQYEMSSPAKYVRSPPDIRVNLTDLTQPPTTQLKISDRLLCTNTECCTLALPTNITLTLPILSLTNLTPPAFLQASPRPRLPSCPHQPILSLSWLGLKNLIVSLSAKFFKVLSQNNKKVLT
jgi:hypothetical protein